MSDDYKVCKQCANFGKLCPGNDKYTSEELCMSFDYKDNTASFPRIELKDSGTRREFETGAVRDMSDGKGRCDLMPLDVLSKFVHGKVFDIFNRFKQDGNPEHLIALVQSVLDSTDEWSGWDDMFLDLAKHFEAGAKKYGENNWQKGIDTWCYIDSAIRHYLKWQRGDADEPHDRAFVWNVVCCIWTCYNRPELNTYLKE